MINRIENISYIKEYLISLSFNNSQLILNEMRAIDCNLEYLHIEESEVQTGDIYGESDSFMESKKNFREYPILQTKYCYNDNKCETKELNFDYKY